MRLFLAFFLCCVGNSFSFQNDLVEYSEHHYSDFKRFESLIMSNFNRKLNQDAPFERSPSSQINLGKKVILLQKLEMNSAPNGLLNNSSVKNFDPRGFLKGKLVFIEDMMVSLY